MLHKPGKLRYDIPKAHRPITLMNTLGKLLSSLVAEDLSFMCEQYALLLDNHFSSRPGQCTTDMMHLLAHKIKAAWHRHNVAAILFLDVEGAFPNAISAQLLHNMHMRHVPEEYVLFVDWLLTNRCMQIKFDGFMLDWIDVDNGIVQGDLLSMILYLFYNADLMEDMGKMETMVGYMDDVNFYAEGCTFDAAYAKLSDMMTQEGGGQDWSKLHNSKFKMSKLTLVGFSHWHVQDPARLGKLKAEPWPNLSLCGTDIKLAESHKFLGVVFDQELWWNTQVEQVIAKATKWTLASQRLARPAASISPQQMCQLYQVVAVPSFTYAADVWFMPICKESDTGKSSGSVGVVCKLSTVQRMAMTAITGVLHTSASDVLEAHANLLPVELLLHRICH